jgi:hypothetical protein
VAQTKKKRRRKHRGTQGGRIDSRPKGRPQNRAEARQRAKQKRASRGGSGGRAAAPRGQRPVSPPSWRTATFKALAAAVVFFLLLAVVFGRPTGASAALAGMMSLFYIPMAYYVDKFFFNRRIAQEAQQRD